MKDTQFAYLETKRPPKTDSALVSSLTQHWQSRHLHGKALFISDKPSDYAKLLKRRWASAMQTVQQTRAHTVDANILLDLTHTITRMQQMIVADVTPHEYPAAHFWCITAEQLADIELPRTCHTVYIASHLSDIMKDALISSLPAHSLVVDLASNTPWNLTPKAVLEQKVDDAWNELVVFLERHNIFIQQLVEQQHTIDAIDNALDTLLDTGNSFLRHSRQFQEVLHLAQPLPLTFAKRQQFEVATMLARRVAILTPGVVHHSLIQSNNDTFSLYDVVAHKLSHESLAVAIERHLAAGRSRLAQALKTAFVNNVVF